MTKPSISRSDGGKELSAVPLSRNSIFSRNEGASSLSHPSSEMYITPGFTYLQIDSNGCRKISDEAKVAKLKTDGSFIKVIGIDDNPKHLGNLLDAFESITEKYTEATFFATAALITSNEIYDETGKLLEKEDFDMCFFDNSLGTKKLGSELALALGERLRRDSKEDSTILFGNTSDSISAAEMGVTVLLPGKTLDTMVKRKYPPTIVDQILLYKNLKEKLGASMASSPDFSKSSPKKY